MYRRGNIALLQLACSDEATAPSDIESCTGYPDWQTSAYVLPYAAGAAFRVSQGNCSPAGQGHRGSERYGYDFEMTIGTAVHAARAGRVIHVREHGEYRELPSPAFSVHMCDPVLMGSVNCPSQAATFRNTEANPNGLQRNRSYIALPF